MARFLRTAILLTCLLYAGTAFAGTFYIAANGSDSNNGTSQTTPWLHAPGMPNCSASCAAHNPAPGDQFIFRGGDTWHFGNSGAAPFTGGTWTWTWNGSGGNPIYVGVDQTWFSGSSWARPVLTGDNPLSTSTTLSKCSFQVGTTNQFLFWESLSNVTLDNFEFTGLCEGPTGGSLNNMDHYVTYDASVITFQNLYLHGWTHVQFSSGCAAANPTWPCFSIFMFRGGTTAATGSRPGSTFDKIVVDGADSDPAAGGVCYCDFYSVSNSVFRNAAQIVARNPHILHDTLIENWYDPGDKASHGNLWESTSDYQGVNAYYNNVFRHISPDGRTQVGIWPMPCTSSTIGIDCAVNTTDYWFNNLMYDTNTVGGNYFNTGQNSNSGNQGQMYIFNNTFEQEQIAPIFTCAGGNTQFPFTAANNLLILDAPSPYAAGCASQGTYITNKAITHAAASSGALTAAQTFAYSSTSQSSLTVGKGTNQASYCNALSNAGLSAAATACQADTTYACSYNSGNHTVSCPERTAIARPNSAWDVGAYQFGGAVQAGPAAPKSLSATIQ
jgi:hypothetical protein